MSTLVTAVQPHNEMPSSRSVVFRLIVAAAGVFTLIAANASRAEAAGWRLESPRSTSLRTDGASFAIWDGPRSDQATVYNANTGTRRVATFPKGCFLTGGSPDGGVVEDGAAAGRALLVCNATADTQETSAIYDLGTGVLTALPPQAPAPATPGNNFQYRDIGVHWAKGSREGTCARTCTFDYSYVNLDTGEQVVSPASVVDLDQPELPPACGRLLDYVQRHGLLGTEGGSYYNGRRQGTRYAIRRVGCTGTKTIATERLPANSFQAAAGLVSWTTAREPTNYSGGPRASRRTEAVVALRSVAGGRAHRWPAPIHVLHTPGDDEQLRGAFGIVAHTKHRIFFLSALSLDTNGVDFVNRGAVYSRPTGD